MPQPQPRVAFLVGGNESPKQVIGDIKSAIDFAEKNGWERLSYNRFTNKLCEDVRVINAVGDFRSLGPLTKIYRAPGFEDREDYSDFVRLVTSGVAVFANEPARKEPTDA